jgi:hypothetical protein
MTPEESRRALEELVVDNLDLEELEAHLADFNLFEAIGVTRQELKHSNFLAFLLDPQEKHGLGDAFAKRLLQQALRQATHMNLEISPLDLDLWSLDEAVVRREWESIDILLVHRAHRLAIIIENKVGAQEREKQLVRYRERIESHYPGCKIVALFLTPDRRLPSEEAYIPVGYDVVHSVLVELLERRSSTLAPAVKLLLEHYIQLLRRHVLSNTDIVELCQRIYEKHEAALDLIFEHRPDRQNEVRKRVMELVKREKLSLELDVPNPTKTYIRFYAKSWDSEALKASTGWTKTKRILLFEFENRPDTLRLKLTVGPSDNEPLRQRILEMAASNPEVFGAAPVSNTRSKSNIDWHVIYSRPFLEPGFALDLSIDALRRTIEEHWERFKVEDLPRINAVIETQDWVNTTPPSQGVFE